MKRPTKRVCYPLGDPVPPSVLHSLRLRGFTDPLKMTELEGGDGISIMARATGVKRPPRQGEWYISGAWATAYLAPNALPTAYHIAELVVVNTRTIRRQTVLAVITSES
jgi:hypothetical protein